MVFLVLFFSPGVPVAARIFGSIACIAGILFPDPPCKIMTEPFEITENGISNRYIAFSWEEIDGYSLSRYPGRRAFRKMIVFGKPIETPYFLGITAYREFDPKQSIWLANTKKNRELIKKYSKKELYVMR